MPALKYATLTGDLDLQALVHDGLACIAVGALDQVGDSIKCSRRAVELARAVEYARVST